MTKSEKQFLINYITSNLVVSQSMWDNKDPHAMIVGFLESTLKSIKTELENVNTK